MTCKLNWENKKPMSRWNVFYHLLSFPSVDCVSAAYSTRMPSCCKQLAVASCRTGWLSTTTTCIPLNFWLSDCACCDFALLLQPRVSEHPGCGKPKDRENSKTLPCPGRLTAYSCPFINFTSFCNITTEEVPLVSSSLTVICQDASNGFTASLHGLQKLLSSRTSTAWGCRFSQPNLNWTCSYGIDEMVKNPLKVPKRTGLWIPTLYHTTTITASDTSMLLVDL